MNIFSVNQVNQVYVVDQLSNTAVGKDSAIGSMSVHVTPSGNQFYFKHMGQGGVTRTDLITKDNVLWAKVTPAKAMSDVLCSVTVKVNDEVGIVPGKDYILTIAFENLVSGNAKDLPYWKHAVVHATSAMKEDPKKFYEALGNSLSKNLDRDEESEELLSFSVNDDSLILSEVMPKNWVLGVSQDRVIHFKVTANSVEFKNGDFVDEAVWADEESLKKKPYALVPNGHKMADYEYFFHGERGDMYRNVGWPDVIPTKYMVYPDDKYDTVAIHYAFVDSNESVQKSEKDLTFIVPEGKGEQFKEQLESTLNLDIPVAESYKTELSYYPSGVIEEVDPPIQENL